jgi:hypothetical protein
VKGWESMPVEKRVKIKQEEERLRKIRDRENLNFMDVSQIDNWKTPIGEATLKGLQNNDRGEAYDRNQEDFNNKNHFSTNQYDKYDNA